MPAAKVPLTNKPGKTNWVERFHALPKDSWIRRAAEHIKAKGKPDSLAIPYAVNAARRICSTGDTNLPGFQQVNPKSREEACAALVVWKAAAARAKASDLTARAEIRAIDLAAAYIDHAEFGNPHCPRGATSAYLDLAEQREDVVDLAFHPDQPRGFHGRWTKMAGTAKSLADRGGAFLSEHQHDTIGAHALAHGEPKSVTKGIGGNVVVTFANGQMHSYGAHGGHDRLDNQSRSGGQAPPLSSAERQAIVAEEILRVRKQLEPKGAGGGFSGAQLAVIKGLARKRAMERIEAAERRAALPRRIDSPAMTLTAARQALARDLAAER